MSKSASSDSFCFRSPQRLPVRPISYAVLVAALLSTTVFVSLHAMPVSSALPLVLVSQTNPPLYNSDGTKRTNAAGAPMTSPRLIELEFANPLINPSTNTKVRILLPQNYPKAGANYPVLYLLHGGQPRGGGRGGAHVWTQNILAPQTLFDFTGDKDVVIVMPDGGDLGFYSDWYNGGSFGPPMWETFHLAQLIPYIEANYNVRTDRGGRVVAGVSMGGFGAMSYAARHPDLFAGTYAFSGALDNAFLGPESAFPTQMRPDAIWGPFLTQEVRWHGHNPLDLAENLAPLQVWFRTGRGLPGGPAPDDGDPAKLGLEGKIALLNDRFHERLNELRIAHFYDSYPRGGHIQYHFMESFLQAWPNIAADFMRPVQNPVQFNYRSIEPNFRVWDWEFTVTRDVVEFLYLTNVSKSGLTIRGSGDIRVRTAPGFLPHHDYSLNVSGAAEAKVSPEKVKADSDGRLEFDVRLGKSHALQQYTLEQKEAEKRDPFYWKEAEISIVP